MARKVNVFKDNTKLREGGSTKGEPNIIRTIDHGDYEAFYQCTGEEVTEDGAINAWWVKIRVNGQDGWVSGVTTDKDGGNGDPIRDIHKDELPKRPTRFV